MARVAAAVLAQPERHAGMTYRPTGPALLSGKEMAAAVAEVVGHPVLALNLPYWIFRKVARQQRVDPLEISCFRYYMQEMRRGTFALDGGVTDVVEELTGQPAESFATTVRRYAAMPFARQTLANRLRAFGRFNLTPFYRGYDLERFDAQKGFPMPPAPSLSIDDEQWRTSRRGQMAASSPAPLGEWA